MKEKLTAEITIDREVILMSVATVVGFAQGLLCVFMDEFTWALVGYCWSGSIGAGICMALLKGAWEGRKK